MQLKLSALVHIYNHEASYKKAFFPVTTAKAKACTIHGKRRHIYKIGQGTQANMQQKQHSAFHKYSQPGTMKWSFKNTTGINWRPAEPNRIPTDPNCALWKLQLVS